MTRPVLLDTNVLLWALAGDPRLSKAVRTAMTSPGADIHVSIVSAWEIVLKFQAGKLTLDLPIGRLLGDILNGSTWPVLNVLPAHITELVGLPMIHRDPFDRLLVAQARAEGMTLATSDKLVREYDVSTVW